VEQDGGTTETDVRNDVGPSGTAQFEAAGRDMNELTVNGT
jgi:hypothetical protein